MFCLMMREVSRFGDKADGMSKDPENAQQWVSFDIDKGVAPQSG